MADEIVGREEELAALSAFLEGADRLPGALVLEGEAGIGKTTLWRAGVEEAGKRGYTVLSCNPSAAETALAYTALADLIGDRFDEVVAELPEPQREALGKALLRRNPGGQPVESRAVSLGFLGALRRIAAAGPGIVAVDDVQWLDPSSAAALAFAVRRLSEEPIGLLLARRTADAEHVPLELDRAPFAPARLGRVPIGPLSVGALHHVLRTRLGASFARPTLRRIRDASGGNPFYALEIGRAVRAKGSRIAPGEPLPIPPNLRVLVYDRIATLPEATRELLALVAAIPQPTVQAVEAAGDDTDVWKSLRPALEAQVLELAGDSIRFSHPLLASAAESELDPGRRRHLHRRLADNVQDVEERARHLALAAEGPDPDAAQVLEDAADLAAARGAPAAAAELAELAAALTPSENATDRGRRLVTAGEQFFIAGENHRSIELFEEQLARTPSGPQRADILFKLSVARGEDDADAGLELKEQALREPDLEDRLRASILLIRCEERVMALELEGAAEDAREALEIAERLSDPALLAPALVHVPWAAVWQGKGLDREQIDVGLKLEGSSANPEGYWTATTVLGSSLVFQDRLDEARPVLLAEYERGRLLGSEVEYARSAFYLSELELRSGNWLEADRFAGEALASVEQMDARTNVGRYLYCKARVDAHLGRVEDTRASVESGLALTAEAHESTRLRHYSVLGFLETSLGRYEQALEWIGSMADVLADRGVGEPGIFLYEADELEARISIGQLDVAEARIDVIERRGRQLDRPRELVYANRSRALLAAAQGDLDRALGFMQRALEEHNRLPVPFERARTMLGLGQLQRRMKQKRAARESLEEAHRIFGQLGAPLWAERARAEIARIGGRLPATGQLTPTERRVADLVAQGRSNKEVAAALFVTVKTVERNLTRIYEKLGVRSRAELARRTAASEATRPIH